MSDDELMSLIAAGFAAVTGRSSGPLARGTDLAALGLDSLQALELVSWLEERLSLRIPDDELATLRSVGDLTGSLAVRVTGAVR